MRLRTVVRRSLAAGFVLVVVLGTHAGFAAAETVVFDSGLLGTVGGQKVRINVVDVGSADREGSCATS